MFLGSELSEVKRYLDEIWKRLFRSILQRCTKNKAKRQMAAKRI